ncbi:transposable element Tcb1 transposase [Trichonephila clavipes]|nr:transposable element Tcb1 transposase [Trichonephila clavipes]
MLNSCVMHHHTGPAPGIMVWGGIGYHSRTPLVRIAGTLNSQRYISEMLEPVVLPYLQGLATAIFQQDNARPHVARIVQSTVARWIGKFQQGRVSTADEQRSGRPASVRSDLARAVIEQLMDEDRR